MSTLNSRVVIITGGGSGIGKATAARFLKEGAIVYINGRKELKLIDACHSLREVSGTVAYVQGDVSKVADSSYVLMEFANLNALSCGQDCGRSKVSMPEWIKITDQL